MGTEPPDTGTLKGQRADQPEAPRPHKGVGRRALLAGAAGLIVGAGAIETVNLLTASSASPGARLASPGEQLMTEHGVLKRVLLAYRAASDLLASGELPPTGAVTDAAQIISDYVESFHEGLEEAYVFPRVQATNADLVRTLLAQHDKGRHLTATILTVSAGDLSSAAAKSSLKASLDSFVRMYEPHEAWEDTVIYPALRAQESQRTLDLLAERFHDLENTQYGDTALAQILERVTGVEQQLGIADLATFTPT
jgi:hemerythrin-like domain-containing protein